MSLRNFFRNYEGGSLAAHETLEHLGHVFLTHHAVPSFDHNHRALHRAPVAPGALCRV